MHLNVSLFLRKKLLPSVGILALFALLSFAYFYPSNIEGRALYQPDIAGTSGTAQDVRDYEAATGIRSYWTNSLFGGMPMYQISPTYPSVKPLVGLEKLYSLRHLLQKLPCLLFMLMVGFYIFLRSLRVRKLLSAVGAVFWAFSSYFIILIAAGHIWKLMALAYIPPTIAGLIWVYRGKWLSGGVVLALFTALQMLSNHVQMSYYFFMVMLALVIGWLVVAIKNKEMKRFWHSTLVALAAALLGVAMNATNLYHTYRYAKYTMRGGSELTLPDPTQPEAPQSANAAGLDPNYITQWSYGIGESLTLLVPNVRGGASEPLAKHPDALATVDPAYRPIVEQQSAYWGEQPFTSGPVYVGAFVLCLFLLGCFIVKGPEKWALLGVTLLTVMLSWGKNFMGLTQFFIDVVPLYGKFRAVSSLLVVAEFTIPTLAILALVELFRQPEKHLRNRWAWGVSLGVPLLLCLLLAVAPQLFLRFITEAEGEQFATLITQNYQYAALQESLASARRSLLQADAWRSLGVIVISALALWGALRGKVKSIYALVVIALISLVDLWLVDKRYLHDDMFVPNQQITLQTQSKTVADEVILQDTALGYRVWNQAVNSFNDASTSRWHRSVGGYHAAKLQRYQDIITHQLTPYRDGVYDPSAVNPQVVNMLNTRYLIVPQEGGSPQAILNPEAFGAAWWVSDVRWVEGANDEMQALRTENLRSVAVVDKRFQQELSSFTPRVDSTASITLVSHTPNEVVYRTRNNAEALAVCSEIYYPEGWSATIDGVETPIIRANYILRGVRVPAGVHEIRFRFSPESIATCEAIAWGSSGLLLLLALCALLLPLFLALRKPKETFSSSDATPMA